MAPEAAGVDTIAAIATPVGTGGIGVVRVSGPAVRTIADALCGPDLTPRRAHYRTFRDAAGEPIDRGMALLFPQPASFTGEDVLELHAHGSPVVLAMLLEALAGLGARQARPGEFSERAFLNGKLDLAQAEAVADLIAASTTHAARSALRTLEGSLSHDARALGTAMLRLRAWVEASIDFPDDDVDHLDDQSLHGELVHVTERLHSLRRRSHQGRMLRDGLELVIAGPPNAGKSSLMNALTERDVAIVTEIPGTTRDLLRAPLAIGGLAVNLTDTAGLRDTDEPVERAGIERARAAAAGADHVLCVVDATQVPALWPALRAPLPEGLPAGTPITVVRNKIDLTGEVPACQALPPEVPGQPPAPTALVSVSALTGAGLDLLRDHLLRTAGVPRDADGAVMARARHVSAMDEALACMDRAHVHLAERNGELVAEELRAAHEALMTITGEVHTESLLGEIFSNFCIGK